MNEPRSTIVHNSILDIYTTMKTGATLYLIPQELFAWPVRLLQYIRENDINTIFWVPSAMILVSKLKALKRVDLKNKLTKILFAGEVMPNKHLNICRRHYMQICMDLRKSRMFVPVILLTGNLGMKNRFQSARQYIIRMCWC